MVKWFWVQSPHLTCAHPGSKLSSPLAYDLELVGMCLTSLLLDSLSPSTTGELIADVEAAAKTFDQMMQIPWIKQRAKTKYIINNILT
jgi:hypothetical protein